MLKNIGKLKKRKLRYLVKVNAFLGGRSLTTQNIFNRLVDHQTRRKLKLKIHWRNKKLILAKITKYLEINQGNISILQKFFDFL